MNKNNKYEDKKLNCYESKLLKSYTSYIKKKEIQYQQCVPTILFQLTGAR